MPFSPAPSGSADGARPGVVEARPSPRRASPAQDSVASAEPASPPAAAPPTAKPGAKKGAGSHPNNVRRLRIDRMLSKAELARRAKLSVLTIDRVEKGYGCRMDTKRKILGALDLGPADRVRVFGEED